MQNNFFMHQRLLEELGVEVYESPYHRKNEMKEAEKKSLQKDYLFFLDELINTPENIPYIHEYDEVPPVLTINEVEDLVHSFEVNLKLTGGQPGSGALKEKKNGEPAVKCANCVLLKNKHVEAPSNSKSAEVQSGFSSARDLLPPDISKNLPKKVKQEPSKEDEIDQIANIEKKFLDIIRNEVLSVKEKVEWDDIAGLPQIKTAIKEIVVWPMVRPDIFKGLRGPPKALLLFGPPGTGKTMIGKCIASQSKSTFFSISASSLTSKWVGEGEKMVRALFSVATELAPSVIFIDEIDSLLMQRTEGENESTRRIKTEFLVQMDGAKQSKDNVLVIGATNRPQEIDEAARRRFVKRLYVPLPDKEGRRDMVRKITKDICSLSSTEIDHLADILEGYSGSDIYNLCREAAMEPVREIKELENLQSLRGIHIKDFLAAMNHIRKSVSSKELVFYEEWNKEFGALTR